MAKRFTDSDKWRKPWFRALSAEAKMAWVYLTDNCDHAGIWPAAFDLVSGDLGFGVDDTLLKKWFGDKLIQVSADKYFIPSYIEFQYGELSEESKPHLSVIKILIKYSIDPKKLTLSKGYSKGIETLKDKDKNKDKENVLGESEGIFKKFWSAVPNKTGKSKAKKVWDREIKAGTSPDEMFQSLANFIAHHKRNGTDAQFIPHGSTFMNQWRDWLDEDAGKVVGFETSEGLSLDRIKELLEGA
jgi:hypothetical protein